MSSSQVRSVRRESRVGYVRNRVRFPAMHHIPQEMQQKVRLHYRTLRNMRFHIRRKDRLPENRRL